MLLLPSVLRPDDLLFPILILRWPTDSQAGTNVADRRKSRILQAATKFRGYSCSMGINVLQGEKSIMAKRASLAKNQRYRFGLLRTDRRNLQWNSIWSNSGPPSYRAFWGEAVWLSQLHHYLAWGPCLGPYHSEEPCRFCTADHRAVPKAGHSAWDCLGLGKKEGVHHPARTRWGLLCCHCFVDVD